MDRSAGKLPRNETDKVNGFNTAEDSRYSRGPGYKTDVVMKEWTGSRGNVF
jgi:hypothetical protein